ncbi:MAG TPA: sugar transferase [Acidimicrobiales bacterium]|jgi:lipopolysaccharide/colanic/teichoic acid biosynthesis glycosyltransferase
MGALGESGVASSGIAEAGAPAPSPIEPTRVETAPAGTATAQAPAGALSRPAGSRGKRALDLVVALLAAPVIVPLGLVCVVLIKVTSRGPAIFRQQRVGLGGESFSMCKFRTMREDAEERLHSDPALWDRYVANDYKLPVSVDPRVTRLGRWLRRTSVDELPQLINVVLGDMSIVGPRPVTRAQYEAFADVVDAYRAVRPGMTGYWQVNGRSDVHYPERAEYDRHYVAKWSVWLDVSLILRTPFAVIGGRGAH